MQRSLASLFIAFGLTLVGCATVAENKYPTNSLDSLRLIQRNPTAYKGQLYAFEGEVVSVEEDKGNLFLQISVKSDVNEYDSELVGVLYSSAEPPIIKSHWVRAIGSIAGELSGKNAFGGHVQQVVLVAGAIQDRSCKYCSGQDFCLPAFVDTYRHWAGIPSPIGIGVVIKAEGDQFRIISVVPGSPAALDKRLKPNDKIEAVAQGTGSWKELKGMKLESVTELVRGASGTTVRLRVIPASTTGKVEHVEISLVRKEIQFSEATLTK